VTLPLPAVPTTRVDIGWRFTIGLCLVLGLVAWSSLPTAIQAGDAGEFATVMLRGGVPHPSGYPWMRVLGLVARALESLGVAPATAAALPCSLAGVVGFGVLHRVALRAATPTGETTGIGSAIVATFAVGLVALGTPVVQHVHDSEVWGPLVLFAALVVHAAVVARARPWVLGLLFGLAISHHLTAALLLPIVVAAALPWPVRVPDLLRTAALGIGGGLLGLVPSYFTLMIGSDGAWRWGDTSTLSGLWHHVTRSDYGVFALSLHTERPAALDQLGRVARSLGGNLSAGLVPLAVGGLLVAIVLVVATARPTSGLLRRDRIGLACAVVLAGLVFPLLHNIDPRSPFGAWILERFDILPIVLLAPLVAAALAPLPQLCADKRRVGVGLALGGALLLVRQLVFTAWHGLPADDRGVERYAIDLLRTPAEDRRAIVVGTDDHRLFPILYAQSVLGHGANVLYIDASLLAHPWYRAWLRERFPDLPDLDKPVNLLTAIAGDPAWDDVELYLANDFSRHSAGLPRVPEGILWRLLLRSAREQSPAPPIVIDEVIASHRAALRRYTAEAPLPIEPALPAHPFSSDLSAAYTEGTAALARALRDAGRPADAESILREGLGP
jgi:hypothetical protein